MPGKPSYEELEQRVKTLEEKAIEHKRSETALRESEEKFRAVLTDIPALICRFLPDGTLTFVSSSYCSYFHKQSEELIGQNFFQFIPEKDQERVGKQFMSLNKENPIATYEHQIIAPDGTIRWQQWTEQAVLDEQGRVVEYQSLGRDITELKQAEEDQKRLEAQLRYAQKMEALGTLAGGIAHNFNNLLMGIEGNCSLALLDTEPNHPNYDRLTNIESLVKSGSNLTSKLLGYAREGKFEVKPFNLNHLVNETSDTFATTKKEIRVYRNFDPDLHGIRADQGQIEQVLWNLFVNAVDAMPGGGELFLKTMNTNHEDIKGKPYTPKPGNYVLLTVRDTGVGMDAKTMERVFDPFFTTKERATGTGLGLAAAYGIIKAHGGYIDVESQKGHGSMFSVYLPASKEKAKTHVKAADQMIAGSGSMILLVDDEPMVLEVGVQMLKKLGYKVLEAKGGRDACEVYDAHKDEIGLVILDMIMPDMNGGEAYDRMKEINPSVKVLLSSGYSINGQATEILERGCNGFIQKPFSIKELSERIRDI